MSYATELNSAKSEAKRLACMLDKCRLTLMLVSTGIHRYKSQNICWLYGGAAAVHEVERTLTEINDYIEGS